MNRTDLRQIQAAIQAADAADERVTVDPFDANLPALNLRSAMEMSLRERPRLAV